MLMGKDIDRLTSPTINQSPGDLVIIEEDPPYNPTWYVFSRYLFLYFLFSLENKILIF